MSIIPYNMHPSWNKFMMRNDVQTEVNKIDQFLKSCEYFPKEENILRFLSLDKNKIKVIIMGMEPYPTSYEKGEKVYPIATGRSFEVANVTNWSQKFKQSSLRNILKAVYYNEIGNLDSLNEIRKKIEAKNFDILQPPEWFDALEKQGVLFLNASLTVKQEQVNSHTKLWENFMSLLIKELDKINPQWILWGKDAQKRVLPHINKKNAICSCHPRLSKFVKENPFQSVKNIKWIGLI